jgi:hypothetical protein
LKFGRRKGENPPLLELGFYQPDERRPYVCKSFFDPPKIGERKLLLTPAVRFRFFLGVDGGGWCSIPAWHRAVPV